MRFPGNNFWRALAIGIAILTWAVLLNAQSVPQGSAKIASFDRNAVVLAWYNSPQWQTILRVHATELSLARQQGNRPFAKQLIEWQVLSRRQAHRQIYEGAPIDSILAQLKPCLDEIQRRGGFAAVVASDKPAAGQPTTDVTEQVLGYLKANSKTRTMIANFGL